MSETNAAIPPTETQQKYLKWLAELALCGTRKNAVHMLTDGGKTRMVTTRALINEAMEAFGLSLRVAADKPTKKARKATGSAS